MLTLYVAQRWVKEGSMLIRSGQHRGEQRWLVSGFPSFSVKLTTDIRTLNIFRPSSCLEFCEDVNHDVHVGSLLSPWHFYRVLLLCIYISIQVWPRLSWGVQDLGRGASFLKIWKAEWDFKMWSSATFMSSIHPFSTALSHKGSRRVWSLSQPRRGEGFGPDQSLPRPDCSVIWSQIIPFQSEEQKMITDSRIWHTTAGSCFLLLLTWTWHRLHMLHSNRVQTCWRSLKAAKTKKNNVAGTVFDLWKLNQIWSPVPCGKKISLWCTQKSAGGVYRLWPRVFVIM